MAVSNVAHVINKRISIAETTSETLIKAYKKFKHTLVRVYTYMGIQ